MTIKAHWEAVYRSKAPDAVSWYRAHLERSLQLIESSCPHKSSSIIDVGGGESTLVDDLLAKGYRNVTVLDLSETALEVARQRLGAQSRAVTWIAGDVLSAELPRAEYDLWHDRDSLQAELGTRFRLLSSSTETHRTPSGNAQQYLYCLYRVERD